MIEAPRVSGTRTKLAQPCHEAAAETELHLHGAEEPVALANETARPNRPAPGQASAARLCLWLGLLALSAALVGCVVNSLLTGWMAVAGMAAIGLFYLGLSSVAAGQSRSLLLEQSNDASFEADGDAR